MSVTLLHGDCLEIMPTLPEKSVQLTFADLPYVATAMHWDLTLELTQLFGLVSNVLANPGTFIATATLRFAFELFSACPLKFKYDLIWYKRRASGFLAAKRAPLRAHEHILMWAKGNPPYTPEMVETDKPRRGKSLTEGEHGAVYGCKPLVGRRYEYTAMRYPTSVITPPMPAAERGLHPTQKPVALMEWIVRTYTNEGDTILDPTMGSASMAIACINTGRNFVGIEKEKKYYDIACKRVEDAQRQPKLAIC